MRNIRLTLAYDGTGYVGWQIQPRGISVQATVEKAIREFTGEAVSLLAAGRTDAGVHALGQVANFRTEVGIPCHGFRPGLQTYLPRDILVVDADDVGLDFHATHSARRKRYRYVILDAPARLPFLRNYVHPSYVRLDDRAMHAAAQTLVGTHDFRAFESHHPNTASSVRTVFELTVGRHQGWPAWEPEAPESSSTPTSERNSDRCRALPPPQTVAPTRSPTGGRGHKTADGRSHSLSDGRPQAQSGLAAGEFVWIDIVADGFLYNMVRAIAGTLLRVGVRKWSTEDVSRILESGDRSKAGITAPACGLYLVKVEYDGTVWRLSSDGAANDATGVGHAIGTTQATKGNAPA